MAIGVILGSAWNRAHIEGLSLSPEKVSTDWGDVELYRTEGGAYVLFRHGMPHRYLPNQIPYRAHAQALQRVHVRTLLVTSSVGVMEPAVPLYEPLLVADLLMPENRLPDGTACTMFVEPRADQGHLVLEEGLFSEELSRCVEEAAGCSVPRVTFAYVMGPRTKTPAENRLWRQLGAQVNSMTLGPEIVLANELQMATAGLVIGHKYSLPEDQPVVNDAGLTASLKASRERLDALLMRFLTTARDVPFRNSLYRF